MVAAMIAGWGDYPDAAEAVAIDFARATCGAMSSARCVEIFDHLFTRAAGMARKRRQRIDAAPLDWAEVVEEAENLKFGQLEMVATTSTAVLLIAVEISAKT